MPNAMHKYYAGDDITFAGKFQIDCVDQTPDAASAKATILKRGAENPIVEDVSADIVGNNIQYQHADMEEGQYRIFLTATYNSGAHERTGVIEYIVLAKEVT